jgi:hypothetical protein
MVSLCSVDRLIGELSDLMKRRHPEVQAEIDRVYREHLGQKKIPKGAAVVRRKPEEDRKG